ncbi:VCBS repeat-containing protein [Candidatus Woesearchaeota archaeon]|nr:VCBS repeat-containing protein [Candidatus Woesearchaeota archaeon]
MNKKTLLGIVFSLALIGCTDQNKTQIGKSQYNFEKQPTPVLEVPINFTEGGSFALADYDNDGDPDLLAVDPNTGEVYVYYNDRGQFYKNETPILEIPGHSNAGFAFSAVDWDKDGDIDILAVNMYDLSNSSSQRWGKVFWYKNNKVADIFKNPGEK